MLLRCLLKSRHAAIRPYLSYRGGALQRVGTEKQPVITRERLSITMAQQSAGSVWPGVAPQIRMARLRLQHWRYHCIASASSRGRHGAAQAVRQRRDGLPALAKTAVAANETGMDEARSAGSAEAFRRIRGFVPQFRSEEGVLN